MHTDQVEITPDVVGRLVLSQFPEWSSLPLRPLPSSGTVNALFRLGDDIVLRFPLQPRPDESHRAALIEEQTNARRIARHVPLTVPEPIAIGEPGAGYDGPWTAYRWIPGHTADERTMGDPHVFARDLAEFVAAFHRVDTGGRRWAGSGRGGSLRALDAQVLGALGESTALTDVPKLTELWERCLAASEHDSPDVWIHADLMPGNLLVREGRLAAVIDFGAVCVGDPAVDLMPAWNLLPRDARETYRDALGVDATTWERGRGWAIVQAIMALPYYVETNPHMAETARRTLAHVLE